MNNIVSPHRRQGFTLIEVLVASSILAILTPLLTGVLVNMTRDDTYARLNNLLLSETSHLMELIVREVKAGTLDYPEYYNYYVLNGGGTLFDNTSPDDTFGSNYLVYGSRFYNPGAPAGSPNEQGMNLGGLADPTSGPPADNLGTWCTTVSGGYAPVTDEDCEGQPSLEYTEDIATGRNPYEGEITTLPTQASAMCDSSSEMFTFSRRKCTFTSTTDEHETNMLFLVSPDGTKKTMIGREAWYDTLSQPEPTGYTASLLRMTGSDEDSDGVNETWQCAEGFFCTTDAQTNMNPATDPDANDLTDISSFTDTVPSMFYDFVPITPPSISVTNLTFYIAPLEDPHKAYNEFDNRVQPQVYVTITAQLTDPASVALPISQRSYTLNRFITIPFNDEIMNYQAS